jgi:hypothetical protein
MLELDDELVGDGLFLAKMTKLPHRQSSDNEVSSGD